MICNQNTRPITRELINNMTDEIYSFVEDNEMNENRKEEELEKRQTTRNSSVRDIISILLLRELLGRPSFPGSRPPYPRPPYPPVRPPMRPPRPGMGPFNRMAFNLYDNIYEQ